MALLISLGAWSSGTATNNSEYSVELAWFMYLRKNLFLHIFDSLNFNFSRKLRSCCTVSNQVKVYYLCLTS